MATTSIADAYLQQAAELRPFYETPVDRVFTSQMPRHAWPPALHDAILHYQSSLGLERGLRGEETVVVTGQQPALLTGPLYVIYKAITAIRLAARLEAVHGTTVVPLFWVGSDDHDFEEACAATLLTKEHRPLRLAYEPESSVDGLPLYRIPLETSLHTTIDHAANETPGSELREEVRAFLHESLDASDSFADWSTRILARLFRDTPLVFFEPRLPAARAAAASVLRREIAQPLESTRLINAAAERLMKAGFEPQLVKGANECNFFLEMGGRRRKVLFEGNGFVIPDEQMTCSGEVLNEWLDATPERFSPNVALRCVVQQLLFPCAAYVAGPGEIAYWAQLKPVFDHFGIPMPCVYPRASAIVKTAKIDKLLSRFGFSFGDLMRGPEPLIETALRREVRSPAAELLRKHRQEVMGPIDAFVAAMGAVPRGAKFAHEQSKGFLRRIETEWDRLESILLREDAAQVAAVERQVTRLCDTLAPARKAQERVYNVFSFLFEHGWGLIPRLVDALDVESFKPNEVEL